MSSVIEADGSQSDRTELVPLAKRLTADAAESALMAAVGLLAVVLLFDWGPEELFPSVLVGIAAWGAGDYIVSLRGQVPRGDLPPAPPGVEGSDQLFVSPALLLFALVTVGLAWLADAWDVGGAFVPGQCLGYAFARLIAARQIRNWEQNHLATVVQHLDARGEERVVNARPLAIPAR